jgi:glycosyltransferase involved in cell wall biosynthesis
VIIPTKNRPHDLTRALRSVLKQQGVLVEVIAVDDGGDPGVLDTVSELHDRRVRMLRNERSQGVAAARNRGIQFATTEWVAFVDDDDIWAPMKLREQLRAVSAVPGAGWCSTACVHIDPRYDVVGWERVPEPTSAASTLLCKQVVPGGGSGVLVRRELALSVGGFDESLLNLADWDFYIRLALNSPLAVVGAPLLAYSIHETSMSLNLPLDLERSEGEFGVLRRKYSGERIIRSVDIDEDFWMLYLGALSVRSHQYATARRLFGRVLRHRRTPAAAWQVLRRAAPGWMRRAKWRLPHMLGGPPRWFVRSSSWLDEYRNKALLSSDLDDGRRLLRRP